MCVILTPRMPAAPYDVDVTSAGASWRSWPLELPLLPPGREGLAWLTGLAGNGSGDCEEHVNVKHGVRRLAL